MIHNIHTNVHMITPLAQYIYIKLLFRVHTPKKCDEIVFVILNPSGHQVKETHHAACDVYGRHHKDSPD